MRRNRRRCWCCCSCDSRRKFGPPVVKFDAVRMPVVIMLPSCASTQYRYCYCLIMIVCHLKAWGPFFRPGRSTIHETNTTTGTLQNNPKNTPNHHFLTHQINLSHCYSFWHVPFLFTIESKSKQPNFHGNTFYSPFNCQTNENAFVYLLDKKKTTRMFTLWISFLGRNE